MQKDDCRIQTLILTDVYPVLIQLYIVFDIAHPKHSLNKWMKDGRRLPESHISSFILHPSSLIPHPSSSLARPLQELPSSSSHSLRICLRAGSSRLEVFFPLHLRKSHRSNRSRSGSTLDRQ